MNTVDIFIEGTHYRIETPYNPSIVSWIKDNLSGARWNATRNLWTAPRCNTNALELLKEFSYKDEQTLSNSPEAAFMLPQYSLESLLPSAAPMKHQLDWKSKCRKLPRGLLKADMGMGKTLMAMQWIREHRIPLSKTLIICPNHLVYNWLDEFAKFCPDRIDEIIPVLGMAHDRNKAASKPGCHIINYEYFALHSEIRETFKSKDSVICDESHRLKSSTAQRSKAVQEFCNRPIYTLLLTGTPVSQGPQDYYSQMRVLSTKLSGPSYTAFKRRYCIEEQIRGAPVGARRIVGYQNLDELVGRLSPWIASYSKEDWLDLPPKTYVTRWVDLSVPMRRQYNMLKYEGAVALKNTHVMTPNVLTKLLRLSQVTQGFLTSEDGQEIELGSNPKLDCLAEILDEMLPDESFVIMCRFLHDIRSVKGLLANKNIACGCIHGDVPNNERQDTINDFRSGKIRCIVGQIRSAGVGYNMERASKMIFMSNEYGLTDRKQAEDRIHRVTSKKPCLYIDICARNTVDQHVTAALQNKQEVVSQLENIRKHLDSR